MAASGGRERGTAEGGRAAFGRDVVLAVGLAGVVAGGAALFLRTVRAAGAHPPVMPIVLLLVLGVVVAMARWKAAARAFTSVTPANRRCAARTWGSAYSMVAVPARARDSIDEETSSSDRSVPGSSASAVR